jgi:hypothetical protein
VKKTLEEEIAPRSTDLYMYGTKQKKCIPYESIRICIVKSRALGLNVLSLNPCQ